MKTRIINYHQDKLSPKKVVLSLGCFDGIHLGHQSLIQYLILSAKKKEAPSCLCLFDPLPFQFLKKQRAFKRLFTIKETKALLKIFDLDFFCIIPFDYEFSKLKPEEFIRSFIIKHFDPVEMIVGYDFSFAHQRVGNFSTLKNLAKKFHFDVKQVKAYLYKGEPVSSSRIRKSLSLAKMKEVKALLGRPFSIQSKVIKGEARGRQLGFPTANFQLKQKELPPFGVYGGRVKVADSWHKSVINIGTRPTFSSNTSVFVEVHIIEASFDLYDQELDLELDFFVRKEKAFSSSLELKNQIKQDIHKVLY